MKNLSESGNDNDPKLAACLVLRELAKEAPSWVHLRMGEIIPQIVVAVHDHRESVRYTNYPPRGGDHSRAERRPLQSNFFAIVRFVPRWVWFLSPVFLVCCTSVC